MADTREQRLQMRQRGAGTHKTKEVDFGFSFQPAPPIATSASKTPSRSRQSASTRRPSKFSDSTRRSRTPIAKHKNAGPRTEVTDTPKLHDEEANPGISNRSSKKHGLGDSPVGTNTPVASSSNQIASSSTNSLVQRRSTRKSWRSNIIVPSIAEESEQDERLAIGIANNSAREQETQANSVSLFETPKNPTGVDLVSQRRGSDQDKENLSPDSLTGARPANIPAPESLSLVNPDKRKRKKRVSIGQRRPKRRSLDLVDIHQDERESGSSERPSSESLPVEPAPRLALALNLDLARSRPDTASLPPQEPQPKRMKKSGPQILNSDTSTRNNADQPEVVSVSINTVPIVVHRLSHKSVLLNVNEDMDESSVRQSFPKRPGVNAADVLSQIVRETIDQVVDSLEQNAQKQSNAKSKEELKRKRKIINAFGSEVEDRLFDLSEALEYTFSLSTRLKRANKEKATLREDFLKIGQERTEVALQMDEVRRKHEESSRIAQDHEEVNNALHDLDLALERDRRDKARGGNFNVADVEYVLRTVINEVSSISGSGGMLQQVKSFNALLEKTALLLDGEQRL